MDSFFSSMPVAPPPGMTPPAVMPVVAPFMTNPTAAAVTTTAAGGPPPSFDHPSYTDMICEAILALKDNNGSSKRAIAKYIESAHKDLPPTHSALLTHHLKRLKNNGILIIVKKSYKLASSAGSEVPVPDSTPPNPPNASPGLKRSRGRPPKPKPAIPATAEPIPQQQPPPMIPQQQPPMIPQHQQPPLIPQQQPAPVIPQLQPVPIFQQQPAPIPQQQPVPIPHQQPAPIPNVAKRSPGRPRKNGPVGQVGIPNGSVGQVGIPNGSVGQVGVRKGRGRPPKTGPKKSPGRPRKPKTVRSVVGANAMKRGRGRPPKAINQLPQPTAISIPVQPTAVPYADTAAVVVAAPTNTAINAGSPRPRGRPKRFDVSASGIAVPAKGRGRPPNVAAKPITPRKSTGKPVGRPKKTTNGAASYGDLQRKLEFFQSKVKQAVEVLRSQIGSENISTIDAIQDLEGLAAMDISKPFVENAQPPPPQETTQPQPPPPAPQNEGQLY